MNNQRGFNKEHAILKKLMTNGEYEYITQLTRDSSNEYWLGIRNDSVMLYYMGGKILEIDADGGLSLDKNYILKLGEAVDFNLEEMTLDDWKRNKGLLRKAVQCFQTGEYENPSFKANKHLERISEQEFMLRNNSLNSDWYLIDMEYSVEGLGYGRFDMIGVSKKKGPDGKHKLALIELKSGISAISASFEYYKDEENKLKNFGSGVAGHIVNYFNFLYSPDGTKNVERLAEEVSTMISNYHALGLNMDIPQISKADISCEPGQVECLLVISDLCNNKEKISALKTVKHYLFEDADDKTIAKDNAEVNWEKVKEFNKNASSFAEDYSKLNMKIYLCNDERRIQEKESRKLNLEELKKWIKELKTE